ncbi:MULTISPECIES: YaaC family protein [Bacillaceae]|uniref:YaaC family protein n=1 Tax=Evansella alkalicola TaxID=745819 RepID=A0ABS6JWK2_9BACI|nr:MULTISPECIES: YaaC family protein [Bacillaceae]MBU9721500.1 YaaC family protein [Bacillus alkalicola]
MEKTESFTTLFESVEYAKTYLQKKYDEIGLSSPVELAFKNGYTFVYYMKMGDNYFTQADKSPLSIQPVLYFYGLSNWLKGVLLTVDPEYPATTQVLAHGVSTRKKKKQGYRFLSDEIKVQKDGFFPYVTEKVFEFKQITGEKYKMRHLLMCIPELLDYFKTLEKENPLTPVTTVSEKNGQHYSVPNSLLKNLNLSPRQYERMVKEKTGVILTCREHENNLDIYIDTKKSLKKFSCIPFYESISQEIYLPNHLPLYWKLPEIMAHYLLLYNLSMICRYEIDWWGELLYSFTNNDLSFIKSFIQCTSTKVPNLIQSLLFHA